jgi:hypothetical protein
MIGIASAASRSFSLIGTLGAGVEPAFGQAAKGPGRAGSRGIATSRRSAEGPRRGRPTTHLGHVSGPRPHRPDRAVAGDARQACTEAALGPSRS